MGRTRESRVASALFPATRRAVLGLFFGNPGRRYYLSEVVRATRSGTGSVQRELQRLVDADLLRKTKEGRLQYFQANPSGIIYHELTSVVQKTVGLVPVLKSALLPLAPSISRAFVYGSIARSTESDSSDIDLMVVGRLSLRELVGALAVAQDELAREVNPTVITPEEFDRRVTASDGFLRRVLSQPRIPIIGDENDVG